MRKPVTIAAAVLLVGALGGPARAEPPRYESSDPEKNERVHSVDEVSVTFNEPLDFRSSDLRVSVCGKDVTAGGPEFPTPDTIRVGVEGEEPGTYLVEYSVKGLGDTPNEARREGSYEFSLHYARCDDDGGGHKGHDKNGPGDDRPGHDHGDRERGHGGQHDGTGESGDHDGHSATGGADHDDHSTGGNHEGRSHDEHSGAGGDHKRKRHRDMTGHGGGNKHEKHHGGGGRRADDRPLGAPDRTGRPSPVLNLLVVLLFPAAIGLIGGRALRARSAASAT